MRNCSACLALKRYMLPSKRRLSGAYLLRTNWYWALALLLLLLVWLIVALVMRPTPDADGSFASRPYGLTTSLENQAIDLLFQLRDARHPESRERARQEPIVIIGIDDASLQSVGLRAQNWPRSNYARLIDDASKGGASVIGLDLLLMGESGSTENDKKQDQDLVEAINRAGNVVIAEKTAGGGMPAIKPLPKFAEAAWAMGFVDLPLDSDGLLRSTAVRLISRQENDWELSFAARLVEGHRFAEIYDQTLNELKARGLKEEQAQTAATNFAKQDAVLKQAPNGNLLCGERLLPLRSDGFLQLDFRARPQAFHYISAKQLLDGDAANVPADLFRNRIVLVAQTSIAGGDYYATPFYESSVLARLFDPKLPSGPVRTSGIEIHATAIATMLNGNSPTRPRYAWQIAFVFLPLLLAAFAVFRLRASWALLSVVLMAAAVLLVSSGIFDSRAMVLPMASSWLGLALLTPAGLGLRYARERAIRDETERERAQMMDIFSRCVSPTVAETLWQRRDQITLKGERRIVTVIFTDIRNFTTLAEASSSERVVEWLTEYFARMNTMVTEHGGHISKFIGDGLMIVFGAPLGRDDKTEARAAADCGLAMLEEVKRINQDWLGTDRPQIRIGVGIHTGEATCGVVGSQQRLEYTIIGDTVNLAARLESKTKDLGISLLMSEATANLMDEHYSLRPLGQIEVKGKTVKVNVFTAERNEGKADE
jgi:adenylate cyclase